ncbi:hypothetical protein ACYSNR_03250 [Enterococcus sp. LJL128]
MYKVLHTFRDLTDDNYIYKRDESYPREGHEPKAVRIKQLLANDNKGRAEALKGSPVIEKIEEGAAETDLSIDEAKDGAE